ncbi:MAG TPA: hypothetical protein VD999_01745 [Vitreimonas sp.]|nr:hypothetical protein [Vitreimonas sp.]
MGSKKNITMSTTEDTVKIVAAAQPEDMAQATGEAAAEGAENTSEAKAAKPKVARARGTKYVAVRAQVDKTKTYDPFAAVELVKKLSYSKFAGTITADAVVREENTQATLTFPHSTGQTIRAVVVSEEVLKDIEAGNINFEVLITEPRFMPQLAKFAKVLGPKGLMPNPKNGTVTTNPELKKQELEGGKVTLKGEKKAPLMHVTLGKTDMDTKALVENLQALLNALKGKVVKLSLTATMSPSVKVTVA